MLTPRYVRGTLVVVTVCWVAVAGGSTIVADPPRWAPLTVTVLAGLAGVCTGALAVRPRTNLAFRLGGTFGVGAIGFRINTLVLSTLGPVGVTLDDFIISVAITTMFILVYMEWWLCVVGRWHNAIAKGRRHPSDRRNGQCPDPIYTASPKGRR